MASALTESLDDLVPRLRAQDPQAFEVLVRSQSGKMLAVIRRIVRIEDDANDVLQEAFVSAYRALPNFDGQSNIATWLHRISVNAALQRLRKQRRQKEQPIETLLPAYSHDGHRQEHGKNWRTIPDDQLEAAETRETVRRLIDELPEIYRDVLLLRDIEEMDTEETAKLLGISEGSVKTRLHRARQALRSLLVPYFQGASP